MKYPWGLTGMVFRAMESKARSARDRWPARFASVGGTHTQVAELADACGEQHRVMVLFLAYTGLR